MNLCACESEEHEDGVGAFANTTLYLYLFCAGAFVLRVASYSVPESISSCTFTIVLDGWTCDVILPCTLLDGWTCDVILPWTLSVLCSCISSTGRKLHKAQIIRLVSMLATDTHLHNQDDGINEHRPRTDEHAHYLLIRFQNISHLSCEIISPCTQKSVGSFFNFDLL